MKKSETLDQFDERDVTIALESLNSQAFRSRLMGIDYSVADPDWKGSDDQPIHLQVEAQMDAFKKEVQATQLHSLHSGIIQRFTPGMNMTIAHSDFKKPVQIVPRDRLHVYGPDRDNTKDWQRYYRYAWTDKNSYANIYSKDAQIIQEGKISCVAGSYSGQGAHALVGAGLLFRPQFGDSLISIRPYVQWLTSASFTNAEGTSSATASLGIYVHSWAADGTNRYVDRDHWITVWSEHTQGYAVDLQADGYASVGDGLETSILAVSHRKYDIYVYAYIEASSGPKLKKNEYRYTRLEMDASIPFVVIEEKS